MAPDFAGVGRLLANPARSTMVALLLDGRARTGRELARAAAVSPSTASGHLTDLLSGGLVHGVHQGRHRYYAIADADVATALEALSLICPSTPSTSLRQSTQARALAGLRTCYDHLAGAVAVQLLDALLDRRLLAPDRTGFALTAAGTQVLGDLGVDCAGAAGRRRPPSPRPCSTRAGRPGRPARRGVGTPARTLATRGHGRELLVGRPDMMRPGPPRRVGRGAGRG